jgi:hypothetical protein
VNWKFWEKITFDKTKGERGGMAELVEHPPAGTMVKSLNQGAACKCFI